MGAQVAAWAELWSLAQKCPGLQRKAAGAVPPVCTSQLEASNSSADNLFNPRTSFQPTRPAVKQFRQSFCNACKEGSLVIRICSGSALRSGSTGTSCAGCAPAGLHPAPLAARCVAADADTRSDLPKTLQG